MSQTITTTQDRPALLVVQASPLPGRPHHCWAGGTSAPLRRAKPRHGANTGRRAGFSLTEILIAIPIVVLAALLILRFQGVLVRSEARAARSQDAADTMARVMAALKRDLRSSGSWAATTDAVRFERDALGEQGQPVTLAVAWLRTRKGWTRISEDGTEHAYELPALEVRIEKQPAACKLTLGCGELSMEERVEAR